MIFINVLIYKDKYKDTKYNSDKNNDNVCDNDFMINLSKSYVM